MDNAPTIEVDTRKSPAVTFYSRQHTDNGRPCVVAVDTRTRAQVGHNLQCKAINCFVSLMEAARIIKLSD